jgi:hypothetical protein
MFFPLPAFRYVHNTSDGGNKLDADWKPGGARALQGLCQQILSQWCKATRTPSILVDHACDRCQCHAGLHRQLVLLRG